ncbi:hypothetical protein Q5H92_16930 [Hymenobacter sp. M29]|uniref:Zinc-ribbon 15 domain-containing protein n=1 Tax=Hymenobacter mellowenesis TaxID=3063995 RepID=A0ABT9ADX3_9BACT|nr:hypothetical protein [Hymenobacter sp. M29]MDO7848052.1 hypothetical protein [Hymenobacter sp. M29]
MIFYGTNGTHVRTVPLPGVACPFCTASDTLQVSLFCRYAHIYYVPLLPFSKPVVATCTNCSLSWDNKALPPALRGPIRTLKQDTRTPLWTWSGTALLAVGLGWAAVAGARDDRENQAYLAAPRVGDIYTVRANEADNNYSLLKVVGVKGTTVDVVANEYVIDNSHPIDQLNAPAKYSKEPFSLGQFELKIMQNKGQLTDVDRLGE